MSTIVLTVRDECGLRAANARRLASLAQRYEDAITVRNLTRNTQPSNCKTVRGVLCQKVKKGESVELKARGDTGLLALDALQDLIETNFEDETYAKRVGEVIDSDAFLLGCVPEPRQLRLPI